MALMEQALQKSEELILKLMKKSEEYAKSIGAKGIELSTAKDNLTAQSLYEKIGYIRDNEFYSYSFEL